MNTNFVATEPDSQFYTDLSQLLQTMKSLRHMAGWKYELDGTDYSPMWIKREIDYIIKGLENTIEKGYKINEPVPEGYTRIDVKEGSFVIPPENISTVASIIAHEVRKETGIGLMDAKALLLENGLDYLKVIEYITSGQREKDMRKRGIFVDNFYRSKMNQKENLTAIMRADEKDGLYDTPKCGDCGKDMTLVRP